MIEGPTYRLSKQPIFKEMRECNVRFIMCGSRRFADDWSKSKDWDFWANNDEVTRLFLAHFGFNHLERENCIEHEEYEDGEFVGLWRYQADDLQIDVSIQHDLDLTGQAGSIIGEMNYYKGLEHHERADVLRAVKKALRRNWHHRLYCMEAKREREHDDIPF